MMIESNYPKVLIFGAPFNSFSGGGITLTNLFKGWPKEKIAVSSTGHVLQGVSTDVCEVFYLLGRDEQRWIFPFRLFQKSFPSGLMSFKKKQNLTFGSPKISIRRMLVDKLFYPFIHWVGLFHCLSEISFSQNFKKWLDDFKPDILYLQVSSREEILFAIQIYDYLKIPAVIHMMDDWPSTISRNGLFKKYWKTKIDKEFHKLLDRMDLYLSISDAMSSEYKKRYDRNFIPFHNPIDISIYNEIKRKRPVNGDVFKIAYLGRIGVANKHSIFSFANAISQHKNNSCRVELELFTPGVNYRDTQSIAGLENIKILPPVNHEDVPALLTQYDLLLLPLDFTKLGFKYSQYSIPTKASEYMISGTPIVIFAPKETAISKFCSEHECGYCITENNEKNIHDGMDFLINNVEYREKISRKAVNLATDFFDGNKVRKEFQQLLINILK
jgi:glycosyltransferase involved in cell wall biosynthesis